MKKTIVLCGLLGFFVTACAQTTCYSRKTGDTLVIGNSLVERAFVWNGGNLCTVSITNKETGNTFRTASVAPDFSVGRQPTAIGGTFGYRKVAATSVSPAHLEATVSFSLGALSVRRVYRLYDGVPTIACDTYLKGTVRGMSGTDDKNAADRKNIESASDMTAVSAEASLDRVDFGGQHWHARAVEFWDVTDWNNNLMAVRDIITYRKNRYKGNLLFVRNGVDDEGFFFLKESPCSGTQPHYPGADFITEFGRFKVVGLGISGSDITPDGWTRLYGCVLGVYGGSGELPALKALRLYQKQVRLMQADRDEMVMMNTWGDRNQDAKINEKFCLEELECAARLGISHFQIDDGWQTGKSPNSAVAKGSFDNIWDNDNYWEPDPGKYPHGLAPIVKKGRQLGIEIGLWFNPSVKNGFADWEKDADALVSLYRKYGIRIFKIDGLSVPDKRAEENLRKLFDKVVDASGGQVVFNLDATAGRREGYHAFNEYGNVFLENRYTDWQNYYPYQTLRNVWMLAKYVPVEKLQIEFLNKWRNKEKYGDDPFAPSVYSFSYLFAITMVGQPLAWMEASGLPYEAFGLKPLVDIYRSVAHEFHGGIILPVGEEPSGRSWTGFQSVSVAENGSDYGKVESGFLIVYRENNTENQSEIRTWLPEGASASFTPLMGNGRNFSCTVGKEGRITVSLPSPNSFAFYRYELK